MLSCPERRDPLRLRLRGPVASRRAVAHRVAYLGMLLAAVVKVSGAHLVCVYIYIYIYMYTYTNNDNHHHNDNKNSSNNSIYILYICI